MPKICVALATYNGEKYLREMLDSLALQTRKADYIVAIDDASTDNSVSILKEYASKLNIQIFKNEINKGHVQSFAKALTRLKPFVQDDDFVALADQDDIWLSNHLEILANSIKNNALVFGDAHVIDSKGNMLADSWRNYSNIHEYVSMKNQIAGINNVTGCLSLFRASLLKDILPIPPAVTVHDRWITMLADRHGKVLSIQQKIALYRIHENNAVGNKVERSMSKTLNSQIAWATEILNHAELLKLTADEIDFTKNLIQLSKNRLENYTNLKFLPWIITNRKELFLKTKTLHLAKQILFSSVGFPLAKKIWGKS